MKVRITQPGHPHFWELAELRANEDEPEAVSKFLGKKMFKVDLIDCPHGVRACFVKAGGFDEV